MRLVPLILGSLALVLAWYLPNRPQNPEPQVRVDKFQSLSFAPFRPWESPLTDHFATEAEADSDLALVAPVTGAIRTYSAIEGNYDTAALARKHGVKLWQGIWLGTDRAKNAREIARGIALARAYPDIVDRVIVGNEVLLRRDLPEAELEADIDQVRRAVRQPVAYADVWEFWEQFPRVADHVDIVLVHLLPYWEDIPTGIDRAVGHVGETLRHMRALFPGKRIGIGETGWPSRGRERRDALPSRINEATFLRRFIALAQTEHFEYNFIEAFDQDWKYEDEGIVGANWGLFSDTRAAKIPLTGALEEDPSFPRHAAFSVLGAWLLAALGLAASRGKAATSRLSALALLLGGALGLAQAGSDGVLYDAHVRMAAAVNLGGQTLLAGLAILIEAGALAARPERTGRDASLTLRALIRTQTLPQLAGSAEDLLFLFIWTATVLQLLLVFDPRYREFPLCSFAVPCVVVLWRALRGELPASRPGREEWAIGLVFVSAIAASLAREGVSNAQCLRWTAAALVLAAPVLLTLRGGRRLSRATEDYRTPESATGAAPR